jgi:acyl carrier protein
MTDDEIRTGVIDCIRRIAPEVEPSQLARERPLRDQVDLDSMDWLNVIVGFHQRFGVDIPESDYTKLVSLDAIVAYLGGRLCPPPG